MATRTLKTPKWMTFDCYGTLVNFNLTPATLDALGTRLDGVDQDAFFSRFAQVRYEEVLGEYRPYKEVLRRSLDRVMMEFDLPYRTSDGDAIVAAVPTFGPFPEVPDSLRRLKTQARLAIVTNSDDDLIMHNVTRLGVQFDRVITSQQAGAYKPSLTVFEHVLRQLGCDPGDILHVAQGFEYDIVPAHSVGWDRVWINRYGHIGDRAYGPYLELQDLSQLPSLIGGPEDAAA